MYERHIDAGYGDKDGNLDVLYDARLKSGLSHLGLLDASQSPDADERKAEVLASLREHTQWAAIKAPDVLAKYQDQLDSLLSPQRVDVVSDLKREVVAVGVRAREFRIDL